MKYKAIIFDLDGVICRTDQYHYLAWKKLAAEIGVPFDEALNNQLRGIGRMESLEIILKGNKTEATTAEKEHYAATKNDYYRHYLKQMSPRDLPSDVKSTLDLIRGKGYKIAIGSASKNTKYILERLGLDTYFDAVSDGTNITRSKPDPEVFLKASEFLTIEPAFCLVVEDAKAGIEAAIAAGMDSAAIGDAVQYHIATYELDRLGDLLKFL